MYIKRKGRIIFSLPQPHAIGIYKDDEAYHPTETAVAPNGDIYVADGYGSDYIIQFDSKGRIVVAFSGADLSQVKAVTYSLDGGLFILTENSIFKVGASK